MTSAISSGLAGYQQAEDTVNHAADQIAAWPAGQLANTNSANASGDSVDLSDSMMSLLQGQIGAQANLNTIHVADDMQQSLIDLVG